MTRPCDILCDPDCDATCHAGHYIYIRKPHPDGACQSEDYVSTEETR